MLVIIERFTQQAVNQNLSAGAILLWQRLYCTMQRKGQFADVHQHTAVLMASLKVSRQGLQQMRQMLVDKGFLIVRVDEHQQIFYTLMLDGKIVGEKVGELKHCPAGNGSQWSATPTADDVNDVIIDIHKSKIVGVVDHNDPLGATRYNDGLRFLESVVTTPSAQKSAPSTDLILTNRYR